MFLYFLKLCVCVVCVYVCVCCVLCVVCVCVCVCIKVDVFQFLATLCGVCPHRLCCSVMLCQIVRCQATHPSPHIFISVRLYGCARVLLLYCHGYFYFLVESESLLWKGTNFIAKLITAEGAALSVALPMSPAFRRALSDVLEMLGLSCLWNIWPVT